MIDRIFSGIMVFLLTSVMFSTAHAVTSSDSTGGDAAGVLGGTLVLDYNYVGEGKGKIELEFTDEKVFMRKRTYSGCAMMKTPQKDKYHGLEYVVNGDVVEVTGFHYVSCKRRHKYTTNLQINLSTGEVTGKMSSNEGSHDVQGTISENSVTR